MELHIVWSQEAGEGVVFSSRLDARFASSGSKVGPMVSVIADNFRETYADEEPHKIFPIITIEI